MSDEQWRALRGHPLNAPGDMLGVSFAAGGPAIGPVPLLRLTDGVFSVRPNEELTYVLGLAFDEGGSIRVATARWNLCWTIPNPACAPPRRTI